MEVSADESSQESFPRSVKPLRRDRSTEKEFFACKSLWQPVRADMNGPACHGIETGPVARSQHRPIRALAGMQLRYRIRRIRVAGLPLWCFHAGTCVVLRFPMSRRPLQAQPCHSRALPSERQLQRNCPASLQSCRARHVAQTLSQERFIPRGIVFGNLYLD